MAICSNRPDVVVTELNDETTLTLFARNILVAVFVLAIGTFACLVAIASILQALTLSNTFTIVMMTCFIPAVIWLTWHIGWRPRPFEIRFTRDFLHVGGRQYAYSEIESYGLADGGGDIVDTVSIGVPRNVTHGPHIYIKLGARFLPITVGLKKEQAQEALRLFTLLFEAKTSA